MTTCDDVQYVDANQITRIKLLGMGIVCGLEVFRDTQCFISISKGVGVTSQGHVVCIPDKTLKYYRKYDQADYFNKLINCDKEKQAVECPVWEMLEHRVEGEEVHSIVPQTAAELEQSFLDNKVVLLYLEDEVKMIVRVLLIDEKDMWAILKCTCILHTHCIQTEAKEEEDLSIFDNATEEGMPSDEELYNAVHKKYMLNALTIRRFGYGAVDFGDLHVGDGKEENLMPNFNFTATTQAASNEKFFHEYELIIDEALQNLDDELDKLHNYFGCLVDACHCKEGEEEVETTSPCNPLNENVPAETGLQMHNIKIFKAYFSTINRKWAVYKKMRKPVGSVQYFYDFVKDLIDTYNELLNELYELVNDCCASTDCFPRHLMLGRIAEEISFQASIFRQGYAQPPVYNGNANRLQQIRFLHWRMVIMMKCFFVPDWELSDFSDESYYDVLALEGEKKLGQDAKLPVRITPSRLFDQPLGKQAIPFYYNLSNSPYSMQYYWDYMSTKHNREDHQLSFFSKEIPGYSNLNSVVHPFVFSLSQYPFYRIEGHTGMPAQDAITAIKNLRRRYALSFDVISISYSDLLELFDTAEPTLAAHGLEHVCGVQKGYTFVLLHDGESDRQLGNVVADFQIPFMIAFTLKQIRSEKGGQKSIASNPANKSNDKEALKTGVVKEVKLIDKIGIAVGKDDLKLIKGIGEKLEGQMNKAGVKTFKQLASLSNDDVKAFATMLGLKDAVIKPTWFAEAKKLMENK
jgi:predicted flap endonuclease-1-like 5' DNA nuclease